MKKTIQKPENWQDFESLCKKLWGEIWAIPTKIKKNGRNGQPQAGVDVYGVPKSQTQYWGIQCKGKDEYVNAKLTKKEIDIEIENAKTFMPELSVFIFATSMNKDAKIEEYIRIKDLESRQNRSFEILLFCWEDIADLIEENRNTYNYYVHNKQHKTKFDFTVYLNDFNSNFTIRPKCIRKIRRYRLREKREGNLSTGLIDSVSNAPWARNTPFLNLDNSALAEVGVTLNRVNEAICTFEIIMVNTGSDVIEDWRVKLKFIGEHEEIMDQLGTGLMGMIDLTMLKYKRTYVKEDTISYTPRDNGPLIQKDNEYFEAHIIPKCKEYTIPIEWTLLARDYDTSGQLFIKVEPEYEDRIVYQDVYSESEMKEDEIISIVAKKNYT